MNIRDLRHECEGGWILKVKVTHLGDTLGVDLTYLFAWPPYEALDGVKALDSDSGANMT